jgi:hypothetical protein
MDFLSDNQKASIADLDVHFNPDGWGPIGGSTSALLFGDVPYAHFDKKDKCGRPADFVQSSYPAYQQKPGFQKRRDEYFQNNDFSFKHDTQVRDTYTHTHIYTHIHTYTHIHIYTYTHIYTHIHTPTHIHTYTYTLLISYIHTCTHTYIHRRTARFS